MQFNLFEGARRILYLVLVVVVVVGLWLTYEQRPSISRNYAVSIDQTGTISYRHVPDCAPDDSTDYFISKPTAGGRRVSGDFCFPTFVTSDGTRVVQYRSNPDGTVWGNEEYSPDVMAFKKRAEAEFEFAPSESHEIDMQARKEQWKLWRSGIWNTVLGAFSVWFAAALLGWIFRGFMSIPGGRDSRPAP